MISALAFHIFIRESKQLNNNKFSSHKFNYRAQFTIYGSWEYTTSSPGLFFLALEVESQEKAPWGRGWEYTDIFKRKKQQRLIIIEISTVLNIVFELDCKKVKKLKNKEYTVVLRCFRLQFTAFFRIVKRLKHGSSYRG